jgi:uncharacterized delta-60 repeat protein
LEERALLSAGALDLTFGTGGKVLTDFTGFLDSTAQVVLRQPDGKLVVAGPAANGSPAANGPASDTAVARYNPDGRLDASFGAGGKVVTEVGPTFSGPGGAALLPNGQILIAGSEATTQNFFFVLARYNPDGSLDTGFGSGGLVLAPLAGVDPQHQSVDRPLGLLVQSDQRLVVAANISGVNGGFVLARYNADGSVDGGFGTSGQVAQLGGFDNFTPRGTALQGDGKILLAGTKLQGGFSHLALMRFNPGGDPDGSFGSGGTVVSTFANNFDFAAGLALQPDGKIVVAGTAFPPMASGTDFALARYNLDGSLDTGFGAGGTTTITFGMNDQSTPFRLVTQAGGKILVAGADATRHSFALARLNADGSPDGGFGSGGTVTTEVGPGDSGANDLLVAGNQVVVVGRAVAGNAGDFALARYNADGSLDAGFGTGGTVTTDFTGPLDSQAVAAVLQPDGKLVVAGSASNGAFTSLALARFNPDGSLDGGFGSGGQVLAHPGPGSANAGQAVALAADGKVVVVSSTVEPTSGVGTLLLRYTAGGQLDTSFGTGGVVHLPDLADGRVAVLADGKILFGAEHKLVRFNADGSVDTTFGRNGRADVNVDGFSGLVVQADGKIVSAGVRVEIQGGVDVPNSEVTRNNPDGSPDQTFGPPDFTGSIQSGIPTGFGIPGIALQADGKIVAVGTTFVETPDGHETEQFRVERYRTDGSPDGGFGSGGQATLGVGTGGVAVEPNGLIVAGGLTVLRPDGSLEPSFGSDGMVSTDITGADDMPAVIVLQADGKIVVAGKAGNGGHHSFAVARYLESAQTDNGQFVAGLYQDLLQRPADAVGAAGFQQAVDSARVQDLTPIAGGFVTSAEGRSDLVAHYYSQYLGRTAAAAEISPFVAALQQGVTPEQVQAAIAGSPEYFQHRGGTNDAWLNALYLDVLGRPSDPTAQGLLNAVNQGVSREQAAAFLLGTPEYRARLVTEVYAADLGRPAGPAEINFWLPLLGQGSAGPGQPSADERFATAVLGSVEYFQKQGGTALGWIDGLYGDVLDRTPDPTGLGAAEGALLAASAAARQADALAVATSGEYRANLVAGYYQRLLGRQASAGEINYWVGLLQSGVRDEQVMAAFVASDEYVRKAGGTNAAWLDQAYRDLLGRSRDPQDQGFLNALAGGATRGQVAAAILASGEYRQHLVRQYYGAFLGRTGADGEINGWVQVLAQGARDEDVAAAILASGEFFQRPHLS